ncbi:MAG: DUF2190 family protein [Pseudodesulfovibrio sp.]|uniref:DUF2190 family protein n=1 Tax=Pseudodesulfovibrio sp. TaxID=2035812 RepID=UPI003D0CFE77
MKTFLREGTRMPYANGTGSTIKSGTMVLVGVRLGVAVADIANGDTGYLAMTGVHALPKATGAITQGAAVYYDADGDPLGGTAGTGALTTTATDNTLAGYAAKAAAEADTTVELALNA